MMFQQNMAPMHRPITRSTVRFHLLLCFLFALCASCGSQRTIVSNTGTQNINYKSSTVTIQFDATKGGVQVDSQYKAQLENELRKQLANKGFSQGPGLVLQYWFADADEGSRFARAWVGFGVGTGKIQVAVEFHDANGQRLATTNSIGTVSGGFTGGSFSEAISRAADSISDYARNVYLGPTTVLAPLPSQPQQPPPPSSNPPVPLASPTAPAAPSPTISPAPPQQTSTPSPPVAQVPPPVSGLQTWQLAINTNPPGAIIQAYDKNQNLYRVGLSPTGFLWPLLTQTDALVIFFQGRQLTVIPNSNESLFIDFSKQPPEVCGATVISNGR